MSKNSLDGIWRHEWITSYYWEFSGNRIRYNASRVYAGIFEIIGNRIRVFYEGVFFPDGEPIEADLPFERVDDSTIMITNSIYVKAD